MISDQERREIAAKLREKKSEFFGVRSFFPQDIILYQSQYLKAVEECMPDGDCFFDMLAELIDRPTCTVRMGVTGNVGVCMRCGAMVEMSTAVFDAIEALPTRYCPNCGAEVVE